MTWKPVLLILLCVVVAIAVYYVGYALILVYMFLCEAQSCGNRGRIARKLFRPIADEVDEVRGEMDPEKLDVIDRRMLRNTPPMVLLTGAVLILLGWLAVTAFRYLIS